MATARSCEGTQAGMAWSTGPTMVDDGSPLSQAPALRILHSQALTVRMRALTPKRLVRRIKTGQLRCRDAATARRPGAITQQ